MAVIYQWTVEEVDEDGDIQDVSFWDGPTDCLKQMRSPPPNGSHYEWGVRREQDGAFGIDYTYAYVESQALPDCFVDSLGYDTTRVPKRIHALLSNALANHPAIAQTV